MQESELQRLILLEASKVGVRLFRNNVAEGWIGAAVGPLLHDVRCVVRAGSVIIADARRLHAGLCKGSSDLVGWDAQGRFVGLEVKSASGRLTPEQANFIEQVNKAGGVGICARSISDVWERLK